MKPLLAFFLALPIATYTYTVTMGDLEQAIYILTNLIATAAWVTLGVLIHLSRVRHSPPMVRSWVYPLAVSMKVFAGISAARFLLNDIVIYLPVAQGAQAIVYICNVLALSVAVGYASIYYKKIPEFLRRLNRHQALSRRFTVIADAAVDGFLETDAQGNIWYANRAAADIFGFKDSSGNPDPRQLLGHNLAGDYLPDEYREQFRLINRRTPTDVVLKRSCSKIFPAEITISDYEVGAERRFCIIIRDISHRKGSQKG